MSADKFVFGVGPAEKIQGALRRNVNRLRGHEIEILDWLAEGDNIVKVGEVAHGISMIGPIEYWIDFDKAPSIPEGWTLLPDNEQLPKRVRGRVKFDPAKVSLYLDPGQNGSVIGGNELCERLDTVTVYGAQLGDFYLKNPYLIPDEWKRDGKAIFFWGTLYRAAWGSVCVRYLYFGTRWSWGIGWLGDTWNDGCPAVCGE